MVDFLCNVYFNICPSYHEHYIRKTQFYPNTIFSQNNSFNTIPECPHSRTFEKNWPCSCVPVIRSLILLVCCCLQLDREVCNLGNQDVGSDLIGSVVVGAAGCGARKEVIIRTREDAMRWAEMDPHGGPFPCPSSCEAPCLPCPPRPCPTDPCR